MASQIENAKRFNEQAQNHVRHGSSVVMVPVGVLKAMTESYIRLHEAAENTASGELSESSRTVFKSETLR